MLNNPLIYVDPSGHHLGGYDGPLDYHDFDDNNEGRESWGITEVEYQKQYSLNHTRLGRNTWTFWYNDPNKGQQKVTPFESIIPQFNWDNDRNVFNNISEMIPWTLFGLIYVDRKGNVWLSDTVFGWLGHGPFNTVLRGISTEVKGSQAVYSPTGKLINAGDYRGTFDYASPYTKRFHHEALDVNGEHKYTNPDLSHIYIRKQ